MTANELTASLLIEIPRAHPGWRVWRQNSGAGIGMSTVKQAVVLLRSGQIQTAIKLLLSRPIKWGIQGCADISGIAPVPVIGYDIPFGIRIEIEVKADGDKVSEEQINFGKMIESAGGIYIVCRDVNSALHELGKKIASIQKM